ncbi:MAG: hypothetical protein ACI8RZ_000229 [Myxococcota bacterium]|jgi:hypothetical protein
MDSIAGFSETGRQLTGPASDLIELTSDNGLRHTAIVFHPEYRGHRALGEALEVVVGFLESPLVTGLAELVERDSSQGVFIYPTGQCWSVAEVIRSLADIGESEGHVRAGLELMYSAAQILAEAAERGERDGIYSHGGLTPRRIMLKKDGQVEIIGYALPQVEILQFHEDDKRIPGVDSFRYCPPERIEFAPENLTSDLFGLSLIAFELMTGRPVYDGLVDDIRQQAARGETSRRLYRFRDKLPTSVCELLTRALRPDIGDRFETGEDYLDEVRRVISSPDATGGSLMDLMNRVSSQGRRIGKALESGKTQMLSREQIQGMLDEDEPEPERKSWSPSARSTRRKAPRLVKPEEIAAAEPEPSQPTPPPVVPPVAVVTEEPEKPRWSRPARRRMPPQPEPEPSSVEDIEPAQVVRSSGGNAADLLARIRASAPDVSPEKLTQREENRRSAAGVIQSILGSSSKNSNFQKNITPEVPDKPRFVPGRVRRVPRRRGLNEEGGEKASIISRSIEASLANLSTPRRAEVLERPVAPPLSEGLAETGPVPRPQPPEVKPPPIIEKPPPIIEKPPPIIEKPPPIIEKPPPIIEKPPAKPATKPTAKTAKSASKKPLAKPPVKTASAPVSETPASNRRVAAPEPAPARPEVAVPAVSVPSLPRAAAAVAGQTDFVAAASLDRPPDSITTASGRDGVGSFNIRRGPSGRTLRMRLPLSATVSEAIAWMLGNIIPVRTDLTGRISGWYRLSLRETPVAPGQRMADLDDKQTYTLRHIPNTILHADISVIGGEAPVRFVAPVGLAVPAVSLIDHLAAWLSLPAGDWELLADDVALSNYSILADVYSGTGLLRLMLQQKAKS